MNRLKEYWKKQRGPNLLEFMLVALSVIALGVWLSIHCLFSH